MPNFTLILREEEKDQDKIWQNPEKTLSLHSDLILV